jgi:hypothetical protein
MSMREAASDFNGYTLNHSVTYNLWDADQIYGCVCDYGYAGHDCSQMSCALGDDPRTSTGNYEVVKLYCSCGDTCSGNIVLRHKLNTLKLAYSATSTTVANGLMDLPNSRHASAVYSAGSPVDVTMDQATMCSAAGTTTLVTFSGETGALPSVDIFANQLASTSGNTPSIYFETEQTLTCTLSGAAGGSFALELDGAATDDIAVTATAVDIQNQLTAMYAKLHGGVTTNTVVVTFDAGAAPCQDSATVVTTIKFRTDSGNLPTMGLVSSITNGGVNNPSALVVGHASRGSKDSKMCNGIGTCDFGVGKCDCGDYYTFADEYGGDCGRPVINSSSWTGVETCPGVVHQSTLDIAVDKPSSPSKLFYTSASNKTNTGMHYYMNGGEVDYPPSFVLNMTNVSTGALSLDLSEGFVYYVDRGYRRIERASLYNNSKTFVDNAWVSGANVHPYSGDTVKYITPFTSVQATVPFGLTLDLRWHSRYLYWTLPGTAGTADGLIKRCALDVVGGIWNLCVEEDLSALIQGGTVVLNTPRGIALDLVNSKMYWVDSGVEQSPDGLVCMSDLDGKNSQVLIQSNLTDPYAIALDLVNAHLYVGERYEDSTGAGAIGRAKLLANSSSAPLRWIVRSVLVASNTYARVNDPDYIAIDLDTDKIIFTDTYHKQIYYAHRTNYAVVKSNTGVYTGAHTVRDPQGIAFDAGHGYPDASTKYFDCYGHGTCLGFSENFRCSCDDGWFGNCNMTTCPLGNAWFDEAKSDNEAHKPVECSNMGSCNRKTGECTCAEGFSGGACERLDCPSDELLGTCSGKGRCVTMETLGRKRRDSLGDPSPVTYSYHMHTNKSDALLWDSKMIQACMCDIYWYQGGIWTQNKSDPVGYDCSQFSCPSGDNPNIPKPNVTNTDKWEVQSLVCTATAGTFRVSFKGDYSDDLAYNIGAVGFESALVNMKTLGNVTVEFTTGDDFCTSDGSNPVNVTFFSEIGNQPPMKAYTTGLTPGNAAINVYEKSQGVKQRDECGGHGICDTTVGECSCFSGYSSSNGDGLAGLRGDCGYFGFSWNN